MDFFKYLISCIALVFYVAFGGTLSDNGTMIDVLIGFICILFLIGIFIAIAYLCFHIIKKHNKKTSNTVDKKDLAQVPLDSNNPILSSKRSKMQKNIKEDKTDFIK